MDKNLVLAVVLSIGVYVGWFLLVGRRAPIPVPGAPPASVPLVKPDRGSGSSANSQGSAASSARRAPAQEVTLATPEAQARLTGRGAALAGYLFQGPLGRIELIHNPEPGFLATWPELTFEPLSIRKPRNVVFQAGHPIGFQIRKEFLFDLEGPLHRIRLSVSNPGRRPLQVPPWEVGLGPGLGTVPSEEAENAKLQRAVGLFAPPAGKKRDVLEILKPGEHAGLGRWLAIDNRYFLAAVMASANDFEGYRLERHSDDAKSPLLFLKAKALALEPGDVHTYEIPFYLGPKGMTRLESLHLGLERSVDFGWFQSLGRLVLKILHYFHRLTGNYGWSIILLTIFIQALLFPLTYKSLKATLGMKKIQPEIARVQQKFKEDPKRLNVELMELYKSRGVNPMGGCLPMLAQMPVFIALFNTLRNAWELHGAPWMFWIKDLSTHDPFFVLPILMGAVMFFQNRMNPMTTSDPMQAKIMQYVPVIFCVMFLKFPAGLVLYWFTNSLLSFGQQLLLRDRLS
ncbi:MAG: membrane protein insertase YidC [Elusimicrobia bacterium]|nr:membrane protein insertase YidC [Elusimicrobiota bacterium]